MSAIGDDAIEPQTATLFTSSDSVSHAEDIGASGVALAAVNWSQSFIFYSTAESTIFVTVFS